MEKTLSDKNEPKKDKLQLTVLEKKIQWRKRENSKTRHWKRVELKTCNAVAGKTIRIYNREGEEHGSGLQHQNRWAGWGACWVVGEADKLSTAVLTNDTHNKYTCIHAKAGLEPVICTGDN